jgi:hypothetical protein
MEAADDIQTYSTLQAEALESEVAWRPFYTRSNGVRAYLDEMATPHLKSAHTKLERDWPGHPEIAPIADEIAKRDAAYAAQQSEEQTDVR